jgi:DNA-binding MarR family transcriptional regulator
MMKRQHNVESHLKRGDAGAALDHLLALTARLADTMAQGMSERGLTRARAALMFQLFRQGPTVQRVLSSALGVSPRNVTGLVDALEAERLVARAPHPTDRRATLVALTDQGSSIVAALDIERQKWALQLFAEVSSGEIAVFIDVLDRVHRAASTDGERSVGS